MNPMKDLIADVRSLSPQQVLLRATIVVALLIFATCLVAAGESSAYAFIALGLLAALCVINPHTLLPAAVIIYCMAAWWAGVPEPMVPMAAPASLALLLVHTACALSAAAPAQAELPTELFGAYAVRLAYVAGATLLLSLAAVANQALGLRGGVVAVVAALLALGLGLGVHYWTISTRVNDPAERA